MSHETLMREELLQLAAKLERGLNRNAPAGSLSRERAICLGYAADEIRKIAAPPMTDAEIHAEAKALGRLPSAAKADS